MDADPIDTLERDADIAAGAGDVSTARRLLEQVVGGAPERLESWLKLAAMRRATGDLNGAIAAVASALSVDPLHPAALLTRARLIEFAGDPQEAARAYIRALAQGLEDDAIVPSGMEAIVSHARVVAGHYRAAQALTWNRAIAGVPTLTTVERDRLERFKTNALRITKVYHSEPTHYHYPGLTEREFHERDAFPWLGRLEQGTTAITRELSALMTERTTRVEPYIQYAAGMPVRQWAPLNHSLDWTALHLLQGGHVIHENADRCPETMAILADIPQPNIAGRSPNAMFSLLKPGVRIPPHTGISNTRLVCHLPLIVPEGCWFRVGAERRAWRIGEAFVFDDTIEHEAVNASAEPRCVLIVDIWHPGLGPAERTAVTRAMEAEEAEHGAPL